MTRNPSHLVPRSLLVPFRQPVRPVGQSAVEIRVFRLQLLQLLIIETARAIR